MPKIFVCGDIVNNNGANQFIGPLLSQLIRSADYAVGNCEGVELPEGQTMDGHPYQTPGTIEYLKNAGFGMLLLANNHITDGGSEMLKYTISRIVHAELDYIGAGFSKEEIYRPLTKNIGGKIFSFFNFCEAQVGHYISRQQEYGYAWIGDGGIFNNLAMAKNKSDFVVVFVHLGLEHYDIPLPDVREFYRKLSDAGADCVIGSHPHCAQGFEHYNKSLLIYSLGNFFFPHRNQWPNECNSYSALIDFMEHDIIFTPCIHSNDGQLVEIKENVIDIDSLNVKLGMAYGQLSQQMIKSAYTNLCENLLVQATCGQSILDSPKTILLKIVRFSFLRKRNIKDTLPKRQKLLLRLFENEPYRWVITRYLRNFS